MKEMSFNIQTILLVCGFILFLSEIGSARPNTNICRKRNGKFYKEGTLCKVYYECKNFVPEEMTCSDGEHFNANKGRCDWEDLYPCLEKPKDKECLRENGLFLKPRTDCKKYYRCCNGRAKVENCPGDTLFDPSKGNCEWPDLYTCIESLSTTKKVISTEATVKTSTPSDDQKGKSSTGPTISTTPEPTTKIPTTQPTTETPTTQPTTEIPTTQPTTEIPTTQPTTEIPTTQPTTEIPTTQPTTEIPTTQTTTEIPTTIEPEEISTTDDPTTSKPEDISTQEPTTEIITTSEPEESSTPLPTTESLTTSKPKDTSTEKPTTEIPTTLEPKEISTYSTDHTISKENREGEITDPTVFETTMEVTFPPSTVEVTTSVEDLLRNFMCPEPTGHFPHPTDKHKFVACVSNIPYIMDCPNKLVYKHRLRRCDYE